MDAFDAYTMFLAVKRHFTQEGYDYFKYCGKVRVNRDKFMSRHDRYMFHRLSKKDHPLEQCLSVLVDDPEAWITKVVSPEGDKKYLEREKRITSLKYNLSIEMRRLEDFDAALNVVDGQHPPLLRLFMGGSISPETMAIVDSLTGVFNVWDKRITDEVVWPEIGHRLRKYQPFLKFDRKALRQEIVDIFSKS